MNEEEYYKRLEKTTEKIKTDRCSEDEIENIERQKLYLAEHYISGLEQENKKYKGAIDKAIKYINDNLIISSILDGKKYYTINDYSFDYKELLDILKEVK